MRVMNVKFVGRIIMTILFVFICIGAYAGDDLLKYEIEGEGVGVQGTYLVKVTGKSFEKHPMNRTLLDHIDIQFTFLLDYCHFY